MSLLIHLRQRIKAIKTIKKITHAMRLISMSGHTKLKGKEKRLKEYRAAIQDLFTTVKQAVPDSNNSAHLFHSQPTDNNELVILIGSQKGLCSTFNTALFSFFEKEYLNKKDRPFFSLIAIGKKAVDYLQTHPIEKSTTVATYDTLTTANHLSIAQKLTDAIMEQAEPYSSIIVFSNTLKSFFIQKPSATQLLPLEKTLDTTAQPAAFTTYQREEYLWEQSPQEILTFLGQQYFEVSLQYLLFQSLLSEQAARFISMDNATRNADNLLEKTTLDYNKLRQAKITKELTELAGSFPPK